MEVELFPVAMVPMGLVSSTLIYKSPATSREQDSETQSSRADEVLVSLCPTGRLMAFVSSYKAQLVVCEDTPPSNRGDAVPYHTSYEGLLHVVRDPSKPRPFATAVVVIPITFEARVGVVQSSSIVMVGFSDGYVRGYSKSGAPVFSNPLHGETVVRMTCMVPAPGQRRNLDTQYLVVLFKSAVCVVEGRSLVDMIRANVATRNEGDVQVPEEGTTLSFKKWHLQDQSSTVDLVVLAESTPSIFDHLCEASSVGGFETQIKSSPSPETRLIAVGEQPMIALYRITKDGGTVKMKEVMSVVASKMTSAVLGKLSQASGWLGWGGSPSPSPKPPEEKIQFTTSIPMSTNIPDDRRTVNTIVVSPLGNLAAVVDCFGRVLLLDSQELVIRRMWKGYRDAQCGWLLVQETPASSPSGRRPAHPPEGLRKAQCLCIYAPLRGIVELWPVHSGGRIAVFQVGKGCRLLYSTHGVFSTTTSGGDGGRTVEGGGGGGKRGREKGKGGGGMKDTAILLCPNGQMVTFSVPFPALTRVDDARSHDAHLLKKLPQALRSGNTEVVLFLFSKFKSTQSIKEAVERLVGADLPPGFTPEVLDLVLSRLDRSEPTHQQLLEYTAGVRQVVQLVEILEELHMVGRKKERQEDLDLAFSPPSGKLHEVLMQLCGLPQQLAKNTTAPLGKYFEKFVSRKRVVRRLEMKELLGCFALPRKVGDSVVLSTQREAEGAATEAKQDWRVPLLLRPKLSDATLLDLGCSLFMPIFTADAPDCEIKGIFQNCGIPSKTLLSLVCRVFLVGNVHENNPSVLLHKLHRVVSIIAAADRDEEVAEEDEDDWSEVCDQCSYSHYVGHALLMALLGHRFTSRERGRLGEQAATAGEGQEEGMESWETVTSEKERWVRLIHHLETLSHLSNVISQAAMRQLPPVLYAVYGGEGEEEEWGEGGGEAIDVCDLQVNLLSKAGKFGVCVVALEAVGLPLIVHCVSRWLADSGPSADFIASMPTDPLAAQDTGYSGTVFQLSPLLKLLPHSLSGTSLLLHCAWQAAYTWKENPHKNSGSHRLTLQYISHIPSLTLLRGFVSFLWCLLYERSVVRVLDGLRKGTMMDSETLQLITVCRNLFGYLYQISCIDTEEEEEEVQPEQDVLVLPRSPGKMFLTEISQTFPALAPSLVKTQFELLLLLEVALLQGAAVNVVAFFPTWVRSAVKKSFFKVSAGASKGEQVPRQLQQKRRKFLHEAITACGKPKVLPKLLPTVSSEAVNKFQGQPRSAALPQLEVTELSDLVFLLSHLWGLDTDSIRQHWASNLFAAGLGDQGKEAFLGIKDKSRASHELLALAGWLTDHLIHRIENKPERLALVAQVPPSLLEWLRKQSSSGMGKTCSKVEPTWRSQSQLVVLIQPYLANSASATSIAQELDKVVQMSMR